MVDTAVALPQPSARRDQLAGRLAAHLFTLLFIAAWQAAALVAPSYLLPGPLPVVWRLSPAGVISVTSALRSLTSPPLSRFRSPSARCSH
jgi:hypothetical protein